MWDCLPFPKTPTLLSQDGIPVIEALLSWRFNAKSIQLQHPPLHLTFQGTHISRLRCQTFSTCYFAAVPQAMSISLVVQEDGLGEMGQQRLMLKWLSGWGSGQRADIYFWRCRLRVSAQSDTLGISKRMDVSNSVHCFRVNRMQLLCNKFEWKKKDFSATLGETWLYKINKAKAQPPSTTVPAPVPKGPG